MEIVNLTPNVGSLQDNTYTITEKHNYNTSVITFALLFKNFISTDIKVGCGSCTKSSVTHSKDGTTVTIYYTPNRGGSKGDFQKSFTLKNKETQIKITFKGTTT